MRGRRDDALLDVPPERAILRLIADGFGPAARAARRHDRFDLVGGPLRDTPIQDFSLTNEIVHDRARFVERRLLVVAMALVEVDVLEAESAQRRVTLFENVLAREPAAVGPVAHRKKHLRREHVTVARELRDRPPDDLLRAPARVDVGRIEERHAESVRALDAGLRRLLFHCPTVRKPRPKTNGRDLQPPPPEIPISHRPTVPLGSGDSSRRDVDFSPQDGLHGPGHVEGRNS